MSRSNIAFKEWAVFCRALAEGRQALILRKGGIAEPDGTFRVEHSRFWLWPTYLHQQDEAIVEDYRPLIAAARAERPPAGIVRLSHLAEVTRVARLDTLAQARALDGLHGWSPATIEARFHYRTPGLYALAVRVFRAPAAFEVQETPAQAGCKSWVELERERSAEGAVPVLAEADYARVLALIIDGLTTG